MTEQPYQRDFKMIIDNASEGIVILQDGHIVYHNSAASCITGIPPEYYIGTHVGDIFTPDDAQRMVERYQRCLNGEDLPATTDAQFRRYDGSQGWMAVSSALTMWKGRPATVNFFSDITERRQLEEEVRAKNAEIEKMAVTDPLTGLHNRRYMDESLQMEVERSCRYGHSFCLAVMDIDHFKSINDTYGHAIGDQSLIQTADLIYRSLRSSDLLCRWGGEEFCILLPETPLDSAIAVLENIRTKVETSMLEGIDRRTITLSGGVSVFSNHDTPDSLFQRADNALYIAKMNGRNQIVIGA